MEQPKRRLTKQKRWSHAARDVSRQALYEARKPSMKLKRKQSKPGPQTLQKHLHKIETIWTDLELDGWQEFGRRSGVKVTVNTMLQSTVSDTMNHTRG